MRQRVPGPLDTIDEIEILFTHALDKHAPYLAIGCFAGIRTEEIKRLVWEDFDWEDKVIRIEAKKAKTKAAREAAKVAADQKRKKKSL